MEEDLRYETIELERLIKNYNAVIKDPPLYVKEGDHRVVIKYHDEEEESENNETVYNVNLSLLEDSTGIIGYVVSYEDVSKLNELQEKLSQFENLSAVSEVAAAYLHEIKNPIFSIRGFLQMLAQSFSDDDRRKEYTNIMMSELDRMNNLLNEFLGKYRNSEPSSDVSDVTLIHKVIEEVVVLFKYSFDLRRIDYKLELDDNNLSVLLDKDQLMQIFINIIQNSVEAMPSGGNLIIKTYSQNNLVNIEIKDEGVGIKQEDMQKLYNPFFSTKKRGTGLGLYIIKRIIEGYGGNIYIESKEGEGTLTRIELPKYD